MWNCRWSGRKPEPLRPVPARTELLVLPAACYPMASIWKLCRRHRKATAAAALAQSHGVQTKAADILRISYRSFRHLMKKYEL